MRAKLVVTRGASKGKSFVLKVPQFVIGRASGCNLRPQSDAISRKHCALFSHGDRITIRDLGSRNGTYVNGEKITEEEELGTGDELRIGPLSLEVMLLDDQGNVLQAVTPSVQERRREPGLPSDSGVISDWLLAEDKAADTTKGSIPETRQFQLDETDRIVLQDKADEQEQKAKGKKADKSKKKKEPGKLPPQSGAKSVSSQEAAAETLRKMFNQGLS